MRSNEFFAPTHFDLTIFGRHSVDELSSIFIFILMFFHHHARRTANFPHDLAATDATRHQLRRKIYERVRYVTSR